MESTYHENKIFKGYKKEKHYPIENTYTQTMNKMYAENADSYFNRKKC